MSKVHSKSFNKKINISWGFAFNRFGLGIYVDKWMISVDLCFFWIGIEY